MTIQRYFLSQGGTGGLELDVEICLLTQRRKINLLA